MKTIALEEHALLKDLREAIGISPASVLGKADQLDDVGEGRLQMMAAAGIDVQVLSSQGGRSSSSIPPRRWPSRKPSTTGWLPR